MTETEEKWLRKHFPHMSNTICGIYLDKHPRTVVRMARELGLVKSDEYKLDVKNAARKKAAAKRATLQKA